MQRFACLHLANPHNIAGPSRRGREHPVFVADCTSSLGPTAINAEIVGHGLVLTQGPTPQLPACMMFEHTLILPASTLTSGGLSARERRTPGRAQPRTAGGAERHAPFFPGLPFCRNHSVRLRHSIRHLARNHALRGNISKKRGEHLLYRDVGCHFTSRIQPVEMDRASSGSAMVRRDQLWALFGSHVRIRFCKPLDDALRAASLRGTAVALWFDHIAICSERYGGSRCC